MISLKKSVISRIPCFADGEMRAPDVCVFWSVHVGSCQPWICIRFSHTPAPIPPQVAGQRGSRSLCRNRALSYSTRHTPGHRDYRISPEHLGSRSPRIATPFMCLRNSSPSNKGSLVCLGSRCTTDPPLWSKCRRKGSHHRRPPASLVLAALAARWATVP